MFDVSRIIREDREFRSIIETLKEEFLKEKPLPIAVGGLSGGATSAFLIESLREAMKLQRERGSKAPILVLVPRDEDRHRITCELTGAGVNALEYKLREPVFHNISASHDVDRERLSVLHSVLTGRCDAVVTTPAALLCYTMPSEVLKRLTLSLSIGDEMSPTELAESLSSMGFSFVENVEEKGQYSKRGGIVDFWSGEEEAPIRVDFFGDEVDRITYFDPITQRSLEQMKSFLALPGKEMVVDKDARIRISCAIEKLLSKKGLDDEVRLKLERELAEVKSGTGMHFIDKYMGLVYEKHETLIDYIYLHSRVSVLLLDTSATKENAEKFCEKLSKDALGMLSYGANTKEAAVWCASLGEYESLLEKNVCVHINTFAGGVGNIKLSGLFGFRTRRIVSYGSNIRMLFEDILALRKGMYRTVILCENKQGAESLISTLSDMDVIASSIVDREFDISRAVGGGIYVGVGSSEGFDLITPKVALISMAEDKGKAVMANKRRQRVLKRVGGNGKRLMSYADLSLGDYVVHASYGIGRFEGIESVTTFGVTKDYITIQYAGTDKLFVPCDRLENIGKYIGDRESDGSVKLSKMGGTEWHRTKSRAKQAAKDIAKDLIKIYAERQRLPGFAFPKTSELEEEFDSQFEFEETESQLTAIAEIKADMEKSVPMNRLLCGDVGFGKTEVALRSAFKAVLGGKQVAILVPTTILALQHYSTALSRMRGYAVNIEMLSRFKKPKERAEIIKKTERGEVDILIGTHALLSKKVQFRDLGLLIIDEEQRFGVVQKERLREMAKNVDTLMLSATPIPRTLNMAMSGINDISVLDEAPGERRPVQTYVLEHDDGIIHDALRKELDRGGQVLYLYNKVEDIDLVAGRIMDALPDARVAYAHGKMEREELEDIWQMLVRGEVDILVCTTIIETGVDLPNANTLVIENADRFGLSQLHQIRGRVGRSERQAYAYFTYRPGKALSEVAEKRLQAIRDFAEFGAGFKIALRDLEIRGAGNLLGAEQHGYIESVGYDLYLKLLNEAVLEERGETKAESFEATIAISISAHIPESYISSSASRMEMYKKISLIECDTDADDVIDEFIDRFGEMPRATERLVNVALSKAIASRAKITRVELKGGKLVFVMDKPSLEIWAELFSKHKELSFMYAGSPNIVYRMKGDEDPTVAMVGILREYSKQMDALS